MTERVFVMPDLGEGLEEGTIVEWLVAEGEEVTLNQPLVEVETAKAVVEIPSPFAGRVVVLHGARGQNVAVGAALVTFEVESAEEEGEEEDPGRGTASLARVRSLGPDGPAPPSPPPPNGVRGTPRVRKLAKDLGVDLGVVAGSGAEGRITEEDVRRAAGDTRDGTQRVPVTPARRTIAGNLERQAAIPQVTTFRTVDCSALQHRRRELDISPLPLVVAALCRTVRDHPLLNASWGEDHLRTPAEIDVGLAADTERGLVVPVLHDAGSRSVRELATEIRRLATAARDGTLAPTDLTGATIAVSNTGSYGSEAGTPILSPGTSVTLAFGVIEDRALVAEGEVVARPAATISLTFDHRVLDGAAVGRALTDLVALLESAERLGGLL
jgi:pyruvate dehydrogenase E2 component (dihydrolipoamide acetyltransferase)